MANEFKIKNGLIVSGSAEIEQDLIVRGTLTADEYYISVTSSSILYESGSTVFGNSLDDIHKFTGSVQITGSISLNGQAIGTGKLDETTFNSYTSSISSSIGELSSSVATTTSGLTSTITSLSSSVASIDNTQNGRLDSLETASGSIRTDFNSFTSSYTTVSGSLDSRLDVLEAYSGSQLVPSSSMSFRTLETSVYCKNITGVQIDKGTVVRIVGSVGDNPLIAPAGLLTEGESANTLGFALQNIPNDDFGMVITEGILIGVNTSGMTAGDLLYLGANGTFTTNPPAAPNHGVRLGEVLRVQQNQGSIYVRVDNGIELNEAHDVIYSSGITHGDLLIRSGSVWKNGKSLEGDYLVTGSVNITGSISLNGQSITSIDTTIKNKLNTESVVSGSSQISITGTTGYSTFSSSMSSSIGDLSSSIATTDSNQNTRLGLIETSTGSLNTFTSSASERLTSLETASGSIRTDFNTYTGSNNTTNTTQDGRLTSIEGITGSISSLNTYTGSNNTVIGTLQTSTSSLNSYTSSNTTNIDAIHISTGSFKSFTSSFDTAFGMSGADVTIKGNLTVSGTQTTVNSTTVAIGDNIIQLNGTGATNAGIVVRDATAPNAISGSLLWDTTNDYWIAGPLGSEQRIVRETEFNNSVTRIGNIETATASLNSFTSSINTTIKSKLNSDGVVSGSSQITFGSISSIPGGLVSGSSQIDLTSTTNYASGILTRLNAVGVFSGSAQVTGIGNAQLTNSSFFVGTTSISLGRASASQTLTGVSIDGNAATVSNGVYTTGDQSIGGAKTFTGTISVTASEGREINTFMPSSYTTNDLVSGHEYGWYDDHWRLGMTRSASAPGADFVIQWNTARRLSLTNSGNLTVTGTIGASNLSGTNTGDQTNITGNAGTVTNGVYTTGDQTISGTKTFSSIKGSSYFDAQANSGFRIRNSADSANAGGFTRRGLWEGNSNYDIGIWAETGYGVYIYSNGSATPRITLDTSGNTNVNGYLGVGQSPSTSYRIITAGDIYLNGNANGWAEGTWKQRRGGATFYDVLDTNSYSSYALPLGGGTMSGTISFTNVTGNKIDLYYTGDDRYGIQVQSSELRIHAGAQGASTGGVTLGKSTGSVFTEYLRIRNDGHVIPGSNGNQNLGSSTLRWATVFTSDLSLSNGIGDYTIVEGEEKLYLYNNKNNKVYSFVLQEEDPATATPKKS